MESREYLRKNFLSTLMKIPHGKLEAYIPDGLLALGAEPELFAHFIAWNRIKGKVRDSKTAFPVIALRRGGKEDRDLIENAVAHFIKLSPRDMVKAYEFSKQMTKMHFPATPFAKEVLWQGIHLFLERLERNPAKWDRVALQHRGMLKKLYRIVHHKPSDRADQILFKELYPADSVFERVSRLRIMGARELAGTILNDKLPFEIIVSQKYVKDKDVLLALVEGMTGNQLVTNAKMLERLGVKNDPILKSSFEQALQRATKDKKLNVLKAGHAAEQLDGDADESGDSVAADLLNLQAQATGRMASIEGDWLILGDSSSSMSASVDLAKKIAAIIAERVKGKVWLIFFDTQPYPFDVTGKTLFQIQDMTKRVRAQGCTSIGCGVDYLMQKGETVDGIAIVSDGGDNTNPYFHEAYQKYCKKFGIEPTVYYYHTDGADGSGLEGWCNHAKIQLEKFDMRGKQIDYYSLPNVIQTMRVNRYSLVDEIMSVPLLKLTKGE